MFPDRTKPDGGGPCCSAIPRPGPGPAAQRTACPLVAGPDPADALEPLDRRDSVPDSDELTPEKAASSAWPSLLGVFAHPDDESLLAGGVLAQHAAAHAPLSSP